MTTPTISIIVPVNNVDKYLKTCLDSILNQTFIDWECIIVDDGSTDNSPALCDEYAAKDKRFKVIHQSYGGVSNARNNALRIIKGDYVGFVDADDWIDAEFLSNLYQLITENDADISMVGFRKEYIGRHSDKHLTNKARTIDGETAIREIGYDKLPNYVWNKLHKRSIITCDFPEGRNFKDIFVYGKWLTNVKKMVIDPTILYHYRMRKGSIIHANPAKNRYDYFLSCIDRMEMIKSPDNSEMEKSKRNAYINKSAVQAAKRIARQEKNKMMRVGSIERIRTILINYSLPKMIYMKPKTWMRAYILRKYPKLFIFLMRGVYIFDLDYKHRYANLYE